LLEKAMIQLCLRALLILTLLLSALVLTEIPSAAAEISGCSGPSENTGGETLGDALANSRSCQSALKTYRDCTWGSSADTGFSAIVVGKCEQDFIKKLNAAEMQNYADRMQLCAYRYSMVQGTLYMSIAATCQADLAASFAANPSKARTPLPRASFDCAKAKTPVEKTICAAPALGRADLVLNDSYNDAIDPALPPQDKQHLADHQRQWLERTVAKCKPDGTADQTIVDCLRSAFEARFTAFEQCSEAGTVDCVDESEQDESTPAKARASFDCDKPETALEVVICADSDLGQTDIDLAAAYKTALAETTDQLRDTIIKSERSWLKFVETSCPLGVIGAIPPLEARICVKSAFKERVKQLGRCSSDQKQDAACFWQFSLRSIDTDTQPPVAPHSVKLLDMPNK
jgi:uncharacterized protein